jgi:hypothetical protein
MSKICLAFCGALGISLCFGAVHATSARSIPKEVTRSTEDGRFTYRVKPSGSVIILRYNGSEKKVNVPRLIYVLGLIGDRPVDEIAEHCFRGNNHVEKVVIPDTVKTLGAHAFGSCPRLREVTFGEDSELNSIGNGCFGANVSLARIEIPPSVTTIGDSAFEDASLKCEALFPEDSALESIGERAFSRTKATYISLPKTVKTIGAEAFSESWLTGIFIPEDCVKMRVGGRCFSGTQIVESDIPAGVICDGSAIQPSTPEDAPPFFLLAREIYALSQRTTRSLQVVINLLSATPPNAAHPKGKLDGVIDKLERVIFKLDNWFSWGQSWAELHVLWEHLAQEDRDDDTKYDLEERDAEVLSKLRVAENQFQSAIKKVGAALTGWEKNWRPSDPVSTYVWDVRRNPNDVASRVMAAIGYARTAIDLLRYYDGMLRYPAAY